MQLSQLLKKTRLYFWNLNFDEVEIPYLNSSLPLEPNIYSFSTAWSQSQAKFYLPTSPEFALKQHLSTTKKDCFSIAHCFRDLEAEGPHHTKEFLMLEWYLVNQDLTGLMKSVEHYVSQFVRNLKFEILNLPSNLPTNEPDFNQFFLNEIEPNLPSGPVFVVGYPAFLSPLADIAKIDAVNNFSEHSERVIPTLVGRQPEGSEHRKNSFTSQPISQRFELYINHIEIANGCVENRDPVSIKKAFESELEYRLKNHLPTHPYSQDFIDMSSKLPPSAGVGLGLNRLLLI